MQPTTIQKSWRPWGLLCIYGVRRSTHSHSIEHMLIWYLFSWESEFFVHPVCQSCGHYLPWQSLLSIAIGPNQCLCLLTVCLRPKPVALQPGWRRLMGYCPYSSRMIPPAQTDTLYLEIFVWTRALIYCSQTFASASDRGSCFLSICIGIHYQQYH